MLKHLHLAGLAAAFAAGTQRQLFLLTGGYHLPYGPKHRLRFEATFTDILDYTNFAPPALKISNSSAFGALTRGGNRPGQLELCLDF